MHSPAFKSTWRFEDHGCTEQGRVGREIRSGEGFLQAGPRQDDGRRRDALGRRGRQAQGRLQGRLGWNQAQSRRHAQRHGRRRQQVIPTQSDSQTSRPSSTFRVDDGLRFSFATSSVFFATFAVKKVSLYRKGRKEDAKDFLSRFPVRRYSCLTC